MKLLSLLLLLLISLSSFGQKFTGVSLEAPRKEINGASLTSVSNINAEWIGIIPFGYMRKEKTQIVYDFETQHWGETKAGVKKSIQVAKSQGFKIMLKPQIWISNQFVGDIDFSDTPDKWAELEKNYTQFILGFAKLADSLNIELLSIGCEYKTWVVKRPHYWSNLITEIKKHYDGALTYAANWDNFYSIRFWSKLDYIGIDSYFPMGEEATPSVKMMQAKWDRLIPIFKRANRKFNKQILFTEYGFRSVDQNVKETWDSEKPGAVNELAQKNAYQAFFNSIWSEKWFAGGFLWKWTTDHKNAGGQKNNRFTPQNKLAEKVIEIEFKKYNSKI